jgi:organic hydroperoxide reductase OsmC/OhrA
MPEFVHHYETAAVWTGDRRGTLSAPNRPTISFGAPPEFAGTDDVWSPEHLCVAAVNTCTVLTLVAVAANSRVPIKGCAASAQGTLEKVEGRGAVITRVHVKLTVTVGPDVARDKLDRILELAEKNCFVSNSLQAAVTVEHDVVVA